MKYQINEEVVECEKIEEQVGSVEIEHGLFTKVDLGVIPVEKHVLFDVVGSDNVASHPVA